jgi:hypothetical protein
VVPTCFLSLSFAAAVVVVVVIRALKMIHQRKMTRAGWPYCHRIFNEGNLQFEFEHFTNKKLTYDKHLFIKSVLI